MHKLSIERREQLKALCAVLQIKINDLSLMDTALTHTSYAHEAKGAPKPLHNERLEFLGDSVLSLIVCTYIYSYFPDMDEGALTKLRARVVCEHALAQYARKLDLGRYILLGKGEETSGGRDRSSILADAVEAIIGACYIDQGWEETNQTALALFKHAIDDFALSDDVFDYKTKLQEIAQRNGEVAITYIMLGEEGPDHHKIFKMAVCLNDKTAGSGEGRSKKEAEQMAAKHALREMGRLKNSS